MNDFLKKFDKLYNNLLAIEHYCPPTVILGEEEFNYISDHIPELLSGVQVIITDNDFVKRNSCFILTNK